MRVFDLTLPLDASTPVYVDADGYRDPAYAAHSWATIPKQGYSVHRLEMGSHTGTHVDAPAHFHAAGRTVDQLLPVELVGWAVVIDVRQSDRVTPSDLAPYAELVRRGGMLLFLAPDAGVPLSAEAVAAVAAWRPQVILYAGQFIDEGERYYHNRTWLGADIPLVTDLDPGAAAQVRDGDLLVVAPLPLAGLDGAPCRVLAVQD